MNKRKITTLALAFMAGIAGIFASWKSIEINAPIAEKTAISAPLSAKEVAKQCDVFNQTDADILAQSPDDKDCYFSDCGGLF